MRLFEKIYIESVTRKIVTAVNRKSSGRDVYLLGANEYILGLAKHLSNHGVYVYGVLDINAHLYDDNWFGMKMMSLSGYSGENGYLIVDGAIKDIPFIQELLYKLKINEYYICERGHVIAFLSKLDHINGIRKGWGVYTKLRKDYQNSLFLICPYPGTGDAYLTGMYLQKYIDKNGYKDYVIIVPGKSFYNILSLFGVDTSKILVIAANDINNLKNWIAYKGEHCLNLHYLMYWGLPYQTVAIFEGYKGLSFPEIFKTCTFGLPKDTEPSMIQQKISRAEAERKVESLGLIIGKTIVVAPYANSFVEELDFEWWEKLVTALQNRGFCVVTNCSGDEKPIANTLAVAFSYGEIIQMMNVCGYFIGVRSGLCDIISSSSCKKIIIYQNFITRRRMEFFSLFHLNPDQDLVELKYKGGSTGEQYLFNAILNGGYFDS